MNDVNCGSCLFKANVLTRPAALKKSRVDQVESSLRFVTCHSVNNREDIGKDTILGWSVAGSSVSVTSTPNGAL